MTTDKFTKPQRAALAGISVVYVLVRFWGLTASCLWFDEIFGVHAAEHPWGDLLWFVAQDLVHPPLFYAALKVWITTGGEGVLWLRSFPVLLSVLALPPFLYLCRELKLNFQTTVVALFVFSWNGALIKYAQEVRMYSMVLFLSLVSVWLFSRFYFRGKNIWFLTFVNVLLVYTHYVGWLLIIAEIVATGVLQRIKIRHVLIMFGIALAAFIPWIVVTAKAMGAGADVRQNIGWVERPGLSAVFTFACNIIEPFYFQQSSGDDATKLEITIPLIVIVCAAILLSRWKGRDDKEKIVLLLILFGLPIVSAAIISWALPVSIWGTRHLIFVFPLAFILFAMLVSEISLKAVRIALIAATAVIGGLALVQFAIAKTHRFVWCGWEHLAGEFPKTVDEGGPQKIYVFEDLVAYHLWYALARSGQYQITKIDNIDGISEDKAYFLPRGFEDVGRQRIEDIVSPSVWIAFRSQELNSNEAPLRNFLVRGYVIKQTHVYRSEIQNAYLVLLEKK